MYGLMAGHLIQKNTEKYREMTCMAWYRASNTEKDIDIEKWHRNCMHGLVQGILTLCRLKTEWRRIACQKMCMYTQIQKINDCMAWYHIMPFEDRIIAWQARYRWPDRGHTMPQGKSCIYVYKAIYVDKCEQQYFERLWNICTLKIRAGRNFVEKR